MHFGRYRRLPLRATLARRIYSLAGPLAHRLPLFLACVLAACLHHYSFCVVACRASRARSAERTVTPVRGGARAYTARVTQCVERSLALRIRLAGRLQGD